MDRDSRDNRFIRKPIYPGGNAAYRKFIADNLIYPKKAKEKGIEGQVRLKYGINYKGDVTEVKVLNSLGGGCDEEAIRIVKLLKFEVPKGPKKLRVLFHKRVRINFKLNKSKAKPSKKNSSTISYKYVAKTTSDSKEQISKQAYQYKITYS